VSKYLGRLVDRAVGLPAAAARPRLAPVFPLGRLAEEAPAAADEPVLSVGVEAAPASERPVVPTAAPAAPPERPKPKRSLVPEPGAVEQPSPNVPPGHEPQAVVVETAAPAESGERPAEVTPRTTGPDVEPRPRAAQPVAAEPRPERRDLAPVLRRAPEPQRAPSIDVRIGRVEVRRPPEPEPVEWQAPPAVQQPSVSGFADLAASRRYVDRGWR